ncbi:hypothetical protein V8E36_001908 [Tilletia maclaganii]
MLPPRLHSSLLIQVLLQTILSQVRGAVPLIDRASASSAHGTHSLSISRRPRLDIILGPILAMRTSASPRLRLTSILVSFAVYPPFRRLPHNQALRSLNARWDC